MYKKKTADNIKFKFENDAEMLAEIGRGYYSKPCEYVTDVLGFNSLDAGQCDVLDAIAKHDRVAVKAGNGWGKSTVLACAALWFFDTREGARVPTTSGSYRQVKRSLWSEIHALARESRTKSTFRLTQTNVERLGQESTWFITGFSADAPGQAEGWHSKSLLYILDEARAIETDIFRAAFKACTTPGSKLLCGSIPGDSEGEFYKIFTNLRRQWKCFSYPTARFKHGKYKATVPLRVSQKSIDEKLHNEGETSPFFQTSVLA